MDTPFFDLIFIAFLAGLIGGAIGAGVTLFTIYASRERTIFGEDE